MLLLHHSHLNPHLQECAVKYNEDMFGLFMSAFNHLPLAVILNRKVLVDQPGFGVAPRALGPTRPPRAVAGTCELTEPRLPRCW